MVDNNISQKTVSIKTENFADFRKNGREISLENPFIVSFPVIAPDEVAVFCRIAREWVTLIYVYNEKSFNYQRQMNDVLLILPKNTRIATVIIPKTDRCQTKKKYYTSTEYWWQKGALA